MRSRGRNYRRREQGHSKRKQHGRAKVSHAPTLRKNGCRVTNTPLAPDQDATGYSSAALSLLIRFSDGRILLCASRLMAGFRDF